MIGFRFLSFEKHFHELYFDVIKKMNSAAFYESTYMFCPKLHLRRMVELEFLRILGTHSSFR